MSTADASVSQRPGRRPPAWLRWLLRRSDANADGPSNQDLRLIETAVLLVAGLVLAVATVNDIGRSVHITERIKLDQHTYRYVMHTQRGVVTSIRKVSVTPGSTTKIDVACSPPAGGPRGSSCLVIGGPARGVGAQHLRTVEGGYRLLPGSRNLYVARYGCFGVSARQRLCGASPPR
jgi:hypothetical protein